MIIAHINGSPLDNRRCNLGIATALQDYQNRRVNILSHTKLKGVGWHKRRCKYHARIQLQGIRYHLGFFKDVETEALAYDAAARMLFGQYAKCNYPQKETPRLLAIHVAQTLRTRGFRLD